MRRLLGRDFREVLHFQKLFLRLMILRTVRGACWRTCLLTSLMLRQSWPLRHGRPTRPACQRSLALGGTRGQRIIIAWVRRLAPLTLRRSGRALPREVRQGLPSHWRGVAPWLPATLTRLDEGVESRLASLAKSRWALQRSRLAARETVISYRGPLLARNKTAAPPVVSPVAAPAITSRGARLKAA